MKKTQIEVSIFPKGALMLKVNVGDATAENGQKYRMFKSVSGEPMIRLPDGRTVVFGWKELINAAIAAAEEAK